MKSRFREEFRGGTPYTVKTMNFLGCFFPEEINGDFFKKSWNSFKKKDFFFFFCPINHWWFLQKIEKFWKILKKSVFYSCRNHWWFVQEIDEIRTKIQKYAWRNHWGFLPETSEIWNFCVFFTQEIIGDFREKFTNWLLKTGVRLAVGHFLRVLVPDSDLIW